MRMSELIGERYKEKPADCTIESHALMVRGGYMKGVANGIFSQYPPLRRVTRKLEQIIREWVAAVYHHRPHGGLIEPGLPSAEFTPATMYHHGLARAGFIEASRDPDLAYEFLSPAG